MQRKDERQLEQFPRTDSAQNHRLLSGTQRRKEIKLLIDSILQFSIVFSFNQVTVKIDEILKRIAAVLPVDGTINILNPVIATGEFPTNLCAIKLLLELVSYQGDKITDVHLDSVMPNIAKVRYPHNFCFSQINRSIQQMFSPISSNNKKLTANRRYAVNGSKSSRILYCKIVYNIRWRACQTKICPTQL